MFRPIGAIGPGYEKTLPLLLGKDNIFFVGTTQPTH